MSSEMNKEDFDKLSPNDKILVVNGWLEGYQSAILAVKATVVAVGDPAADKMFINNRDVIAMTLEQILSRQIQSMKTV